MQRITITAGIGEDRYGNPLQAQDVQTALAGIRATLAGAFGGYTELETYGGWLTDAGELVTEPGRRWIALTDKPAREADPAAETVAEYVRDVLKQVSVVLETETVHGRFIAEPAVAEPVRQVA